MRTRTTWTSGHGGGRKPGSRNKIKAEARSLVLKLERAGSLAPAAWFVKLQDIALGPMSKPGEAVLAMRTLLAYRFGLPQASLDVEHSVEPVSVIALLEEIAKSERHRQAIEEREARLLAAITVEKENVS